jgi:beta-phosphoglucomutase
LNRVLLLDFNGVIVDDEPLHFAAFRAVLADQGITVGTDAWFADYIGLNDMAALREAFRREGRPEEPAMLARLARRKAELYRSLAAEALPVVPGVEAFVTAAAEHAHLAVVSGALRTEVATGLERAGIARYVETIVCADDIAASKPDPAGFRMALRLLRDRHGGGPWHALAVEDSLHGLVAARAAQVGCLMLTTSHPRETLRAADAVWTDFTGHSCDDLEPLWREVVA